MKNISSLSSDNITFYRVVAMTMVVLYHCTCYYAHPAWPFGEGPYNSTMKFLTSFMGGIHMPVFVFISGYLFWMLKRKGHYNNLISFYKGKVFRILVPYFIIGVVIMFLFNHIYTLDSLLYGICHLWFLLMLFGLFILAPLLWTVMENIKNDRLVTCFLFITFLLYPLFNEVYLFQITKVFYYMPFFILGYLILRRGAKNLYLDCYFWIGILSALIILYFICPNSLFYAKVSKQFVSFGILIFISIIPNFTIPMKFRKIIFSISDNSMGIYLFHHIIINFIVLSSVTKLWLDSENCYYAVTIFFVVVFLSSLFISLVANKYNITRFCIGSKIKK